MARRKGLSKGILEIPIGDIIIRPEVFQIRLDDLKDNVVHDYMVAYQHGADMPPVRVASIKGVYYLIDGFHRIKALRWLHRDVVAAEVIPVKNEKEARWLAVKYNSTHGLRLTGKDKVKAFDIFIKAGGHLVDGKKGCFKSMREMEEDFKLWSYGTIRNRLMKHYNPIYRSMINVFPEDEEGNGKEFPEVKPTYHISREQGILNILREIYEEVPTVGAVAKRRIKDICKELISLIEEANEDGSSKDLSFPWESQEKLNGLFSLEEIEPEDNPDF